MSMSVQGGLHVVQVTALTTTALILQPARAFLLSSSSLLPKAIVTSHLALAAFDNDNNNCNSSESDEGSRNIENTTAKDISNDQSSSAMMREKGDPQEGRISSIMTSLKSPRVRSIMYMGFAMALHFGGYEFFRNSILALFTSEEFGFTHPAAYPLANGLISPFSLILLWGYGRQLNRKGPRKALYNTTLFSILFIAASSLILKLSASGGSSIMVPKALDQAIIGVTFLFQSSYQYLLYTQQWSFVGSVMTPQEGAQWFATLAGCSSLLSSICGSIIPFLLPYTGLLGLMATTCITLTLCLWCSDRAYLLAQRHGFDPAAESVDPKKKKKYSSVDKKKDSSRTGTVGDTVRLFQRVPTLAALMCEVLTFQSLNTILNVAFVRGTRSEITNDLARSAYTARFFSYINAASAALQFLILPTFMKFAEPAWIWRVMPVIPFAVCLYLTIAMASTGTMSLTLLAAAFFLSKTMDYSLRSVVFAMAFQPLDFESRYIGKEVIGVFGSRFGKSGMSIILSGLTALGWTSNVGSLIHLSMGAVAMWFSSTLWLSFLIPDKEMAQAIVQERQKSTQADQKKQSEEVDKKND